MMSREYHIKKMDCSDMVFLFPQEIISRLDFLVAKLAVNLANPVVVPGELEQRLQVYDEFLDYIKSRVGIGRPPGTDVHLTSRQNDHLAHLILSSRRAAYRLLESQPETPLGFEKDPLAVVTNILMEGWIDLTRGGTVVVEWTEVFD